MCEIACVTADRYSAERTASIAMKLHDRMNSGLGIVAIIDEGDRFEYEVFREVDGQYEDALEFIEDNRDEAEWFAIHGRLATSGEWGAEGVHPLEIDCPECNVEMILHNGIYQSSGYRRGGWGSGTPKLRGQEEMEDDGHEFNTNIDTEMIAHEFGTMPRTVDEADEFLDENPSIASQNGFIMFSEYEIFFFAGRYNLTEDFEMAHSYREFADEMGPDQYRLVILKKDRPDVEEPVEVPANA